jgi:hypothetical protein
MTLVITMPFNEREGMMIADKRVSYENKLTADIGIKISSHELQGGLLLLGDSMPPSTIAEIRTFLSKEEIEKSKNLQEMQERVNSAMRKYKTSFMREYIGREIFSDSVPPEIVRDKYKGIIEYNEKIIGESFRGGLVGIATDGNSCKTYHGTLVAPFSQTLGPFETTGSGSYIADPMLSEYFEGIPAEKRGKIPPAEGIYRALEAFWKSQRMIGVGRVPLISVFEGRSLYCLSQNSGLLALYLTAAHLKGFIRKGQIIGCLEELVYSRKPWRDVKAEIFSKIKRKDEMMEYFLEFVND